MVRTALLFALLPLLQACDRQEVSRPQAPSLDRLTEVSEAAAEVLEAPNVCSLEDLQPAADGFWRAIVAQDFDAVGDFLERAEDVERMRYGFGPGGIEPPMLIDAGKGFVTVRFGSYEGGEMVLFVREEFATRTRDIEFLKNEKFIGFAVCNFDCTVSGWKLSAEHTCFEETEGPFGYW